MKSHVPNNRRLSDAETGNEAAGVNGAQVAIHAADHEDDDAKNPEQAEEARGLDTSDSVANDKGTAQRSKISIQCNYTCGLGSSVG